MKGPVTSTPWEVNLQQPAVSNLPTADKINCIRSDLGYGIGTPNGEMQGHPPYAVLWVFFICIIQGCGSESSLGSEDPKILVLNPLLLKIIIKSNHFGLGI